MAMARSPKQSQIFTREASGNSQLVGNQARDEVSNTSQTPHFSLGAGNGNATLPEPGSSTSQGSGRQFGDDDILDQAESSDDLENYDDLEVDPDTLVANSRGSLDHGHRSSGYTTDGQDDNNDLYPGPGRGGRVQKRNSIQIRLEKTDRKGQYVLLPDDPEIKEILRKGLEREQAESSTMKPRIRFRDLVFTRQFTTFDRQNPSASNSPFFGFFTLFWLAMVLLFVQVSMHNYRDYGSILGTNQVMKLMFSHEVWLLGLTDGVMCAATAEGLLFQMLIQRGLLRWETGGWIVQNIWQSLYLAAVIGWTYFREW